MALASLADSDTSLQNVHLRCYEGGLDHAERLLGEVDALLGQVGVRLDEISTVAVGVGPGSFTGVRVGVVTAKALAFARGLGVLPVSALAAMARAFDGEGPRVSILDARRDEVFAAVHGADGAELAAPAHLPRAQLASWLAPWAGAVVLGEVEPPPGFVWHRDEATELPGPLGLLRAAVGLPASSAATLEPLYLRPPDAALPKAGLPPAAGPRLHSAHMDEMGASERERLLARFGRSFTAGEVIFQEGEPATEAFLLQEGRVRLIKQVRAVERSLMVLRPGDLFGESALLPGSPRTSTAIALSDGAALALDPSTFQSLLETHPEVAGRMVQQLIRRLRDAEDQIEIMMLRDAQSKIVSALIKAAQQALAAGVQRSDGVIRVAVSPMELSSRVGLDVDAVKRGVQRLREGQYIRVVDEQLEILELDGLRELYGLLGVKDEIRGVDPTLPEEPRGAGGGAQGR